MKIHSSPADRITDFQPGQDVRVGTCLLGPVPPPGGNEGGSQL